MNFDYRRSFHSLSLSFVCKQKFIKTIRPLKAPRSKAVPAFATTDAKAMVVKKASTFAKATADKTAGRPASATPNLPVAEPYFALPPSPRLRRTGRATKGSAGNPFRPPLSLGVAISCSEMIRECLATSTGSGRMKLIPALSPCSAVCSPSGWCWFAAAGPESPRRIAAKRSCAETTLFQPPARRGLFCGPNPTESG